MISFASADLTDGLVSYYKLDDNLANIDIINSIGSDNGNLSGANTEDISSTGKINLSLNFDGTNDYINLGNISGTDLPLANENKTISLWVNGTDLTKNFGGLSTWSTAGFRGYIFSLTNTSLTYSHVAKGDVGITSLSLNKNQYYHIVVVTGNNASDVKIYLDGVEQIPDDTDLVQANDELSSDFTGVAWLSPGTRAEGETDEIGIWNRSLSSEEIESLYNGGDGLTYPFITPPVTVGVILDYPTDAETVSSSVSFNATIIPSSGFNLTNATIFIWDSSGDIYFTKTNIVSGNTSISTTFLVTNLTTGDYEWNVFGSADNGTSSIGNFSFSNNTFLWVPFEVDNQVFNTNVFETSRQDFLLNITTLPSVLSVDAILNYNGTRFTADTSCSSGLCQISTAIDILLVSTGQSENKSFFWEISIFDGTSSFSTNLTTNEQNVTRLNLEICNATYTVQTLNFTSFDEQTQAAINPFTFDGTFNFWLGTGSIMRTNSISNNSISSLQLCISPSTETFQLDGTIEYDAVGSSNYTARNYFFDNDEINNVSQDIKLGLLLSEDSTSFILQVQDRDILPVADVLIFTERFYPGDGEFKVVQVSNTDDSGRTIGFFKTETVEYRFILKQNGVTVLTTNKQKIIGESVPFTLTFTIGDDVGAAWEDFEEIDDLESDISYNTTSQIVSFTYADTSGNFTLARLIVEKINASGLQNTIICSETSIESSAIITCNLTAESNGAYIMRGIITRDSDGILVEQESFAIEDFSTIAGRLGLFLGWFIILISIFAFKFNEVAGIILVNLAIIFVNMIGIISFGYVFISAMVAISIIILVVLER